MKVLLLTHGTRGDVQPFAALARALDAAGHEAILGAPAGSAFLAEPYGVRFAPLYDAWKRLMSDSEVSAAFETNFRGLRGARLAIDVMRKLRPMMVRALDDMAAAGADYEPDLVVHHANILGHEVAERLGVPAVPVGIEPTSIPTQAFPNPMVPFRVGRIFNRVSYRATNVWIRGITGDANTNRWRTETLGLPRRRAHRDVLRRPDGTPATVLQAFSQHLLPSPLDYPHWVHTTGFWFLPATPGWTPQQQLSDFLADGDPPVYIGFGSLVGTDPSHTGHVVQEAIRLADVRAVVGVGWGGIQANGLSSRTYHLDQAPFDWLFPRMAAIVHHGGIGTTAAALASGRTQVVCPFMTGQRFYARRMHATGVAPAPLPQPSLTSERLARAIGRAVTDRSLASRAEELGHHIRSEDGVSTAIRILESLT